MTAPTQTRDRIKLLLILGIIMGVGMYPAYVFIRLARMAAGADKFAGLTNAGKNYYEKGEAVRAIESFQQALALQPASADAHLNLANAQLLAGQPDPAIREAQEVLKLDAKSAAAQYIIGCASLRLRQFEPALKALQQAYDSDPTVAAAAFQLGRANQELQHWEEAALAFQDAIAIDAEHPVAHYSLSQVYLRLGKANDASRELDLHQKIAARRNNAQSNVASLERCKYTDIRIPIKPEMPEPNGVAVTFIDATDRFFGAAAKQYHGPIGVMNVHRDCNNSLFVTDQAGNFHLLVGDSKSFQPAPFEIPGIPGAKYSRCLIGDLDHDRTEDVIVLSDKGTKVFKVATNATAFTDVTASSGLGSVKAIDGGLTDLNFTGKLDLLALTPDLQGLRVWRNQGNWTFTEITTNSGVPTSVNGARQLLINDWNSDDLADVFVTRDGQPPLALFKQRGGPFAETNVAAWLPPGAVIAMGDLNNDLRPDLIAWSPGHLNLNFNGLNNRIEMPASTSGVRGISLVDYDNDGWLDVILWGQGIQLLRNLGDGHFADMTSKVGLDKLANAQIEHIAFADFDGDGDTDMVISVAGQGLKLWLNQGGNANQQLKLRLLGNRSNASGIGMRIDVAAGGLRLSRKLSSLPIEIGVGKHTQLDALTIHWFDLEMNSVDVVVNPACPLDLIELILPNGSCPYLYAWNGAKYRFVTDLLGASPLGLRVSDTHFIDADPDELVRLGDETDFKPRSDNYELQITEELREVLYLDSAKLVVVDHPAGTEVHSTSKLRPGKPFPRHEIVALHHQRPLLRATSGNGRDVTETLSTIDGHFVSPIKLRPPQLRGLAEPFEVTLDFGPIDPGKPWVLALTGWLRFGGGMANVGASHNPDLPFPFPIMEAQDGEGIWKSVDVVTGAPAGKTKTILVDLAGKLPTDCRQLRIRTAFEIHWDRMALFERAGSDAVQLTEIMPQQADLHWRGFSQYQDLPWYHPLTPDYEKVHQNPPWRLAVSGWSTRYGDVMDLIGQRDNALALINGGDGLTLRFPAARAPARKDGTQRDFFLFTTGWDKDADFHCELGYLVTPLPFHGMDDQRYGKQTRPAMTNDAWIEKYNTRWVGPEILDRVAIKK